MKNFSGVFKVESGGIMVKKNCPGRPGEKVFQLLVVMLLLTVFSTSGLCARKFDLSTVKAYAREHSPILKAKEEEIGVQKGEKNIVRASLLPTLSAGGSYTHYKLEHGTIEGVFGPAQKPDDERFAGDVSFNYVAFAFGRDYFNYKGATFLVKSKEREYSRAWQTLIFQLSKVYYSILTVDKTILATQKTVESLKALKSEIRQKVEVGRLPEVDLLKVDVSLSKAVDDLSRLKTLRQDLVGELRRLMGYDEAQDLELVDQPIVKIKGKHFDEKELLARAYAGRDDLKSIEHAVTGVKYRIKSVKASYFPEVDLRGAYTQQAPGDADFVSDGSAGVVISMPIFDGLLRKGKTEKLSAEQRRLLSLLKDKRLQIEKEVKTALKDYNETLVRIDSTERSVKHAKEVLKIEKLKYNLGRTTINFVLEAEGALLTARSLFYKAYYDNYIAEENIKLAAGILK